MSVQELKKRKKAEMSPIRYKFNHLFFPIYLSLIAVMIALSVALGVLVEPMEWSFLPACIGIALIVSVIAQEIRIAKKELKIELSRWSYVFENNVPFDEEILETDDPETGISYVLTAKGLRCILPITKEQVFDEVKDNEFLLPWTDVEIVIATDNFARRVRLAAAVVDVSKRSVNGNYVPTDREIHFLPLEKELVGFFQKHGLDKRISVEWQYIRKEPTDSFKQILSRGYIRTLKDQNGKRIKREHADNMYRD